MMFSQRIGKKPVKVDVQLESMDDDLRYSLWNAFKIFFLDQVGNSHISFSNYHKFFPTLWADFLKKPIDNMHNDFDKTYNNLRDMFFVWDWYEVYDFIEYVYNAQSPADIESFKGYCNKVLEREVSGYRFVGNEITKITSKEEIKEIEDALNKSSKQGIPGVHAHITNALSKLSDKKNPDYRNSIKESISAVEATSICISGVKKATLGQALNVIEKDIGLHPALKKGFSAIYGYTSDGDGIRHALMEESTIDFEDAKYMLVSCSAFINYLIAKAEKAGISF